MLWCSNQRRRTGNGWAFPPNVRKLLIDVTAGQTVLHLFGGLATWGRRLDIDASLQPDVIGDAWLPPFKKASFDVVIIDPPYAGINQQMKMYLLNAAQFVARTSVIWFHTQWIAGTSGLKPGRAWLVRVGDSCAVRCIQEFKCGSGKRLPAPKFTRGPAIKYNRWLAGQLGLPGL